MRNDGSTEQKLIKQIGFDMGSADGFKCVICCDSICYDSTKYINLTCGHAFGKSCMRKWVESSNQKKCLLCEKPLTDNEIKEINYIPLQERVVIISENAIKLFGRTMLKIAPPLAAGAASLFVVRAVGVAAGADGVAIVAAGAVGAAAVVIGAAAGAVGAAAGVDRAIGTAVGGAGAVGLVGAVGAVEVAAGTAKIAGLAAGAIAVAAGVTAGVAVGSVGSVGAAGVGAGFGVGATGVAVGSVGAAGFGAGFGVGAAGFTVGIIGAGVVYDEQEMNPVVV